jgi:hypothetical protein
MGPALITTFIRSGAPGPANGVIGHARRCQVLLSVGRVWTVVSKVASVPPPQKWRCVECPCGLLMCHQPLRARPSMPISDYRPNLRTLEPRDTG